ncbi:MAG: AAA family ATPase [bacterium]|nr:AAA family ATPase [bacterium]
MTKQSKNNRDSGRLKLPIGISAFEFIRTRGYLYVDKTSLIYKMATEGMYYFLSRPRRFGKSLLVSTMMHLFQGHQPIFEGLWIAQSDWEWQEHPVIALDFSEIPHSTPEELRESLLLTLAQIADDAGVVLKSSIPGFCFRELIHQLHKKSGMPVAVLIDKYDKPRRLLQPTGIFSKASLVFSKASACHRNSDLSC